MIKVIELFAGIGAWKRALDNLGIKNFTLPIEIDKDTMEAYNLIHNSQWKHGDIKHFMPYANNYELIVMSPPCQNYSKAKQCSKHETDNLISYTIPIIKQTMPRYIVIENVPQFEHSRDYINFYLAMHNLGYTLKAEILNPLDYNWPQNRPRFFAIYFKNFDEWNNWKWPKKEPFTNTLDNLIKQGLFSNENYKIKPLPLNAKLRKNGNGMIWGNYIDNRCYSPNRYIGTITATNNQPWLLMDNNKIRKLTVRECFLIMGFTVPDYCKIKQYLPNLSDSKLKKMAGNSIVVPLVEKILKGLNLNANNN